MMVTTNLWERLEQDMRGLKDYEDWFIEELDFYVTIRRESVTAAIRISPEEDEYEYIHYTIDQLRNEYENDPVARKVVDLIDAYYASL